MDKNLKGFLEFNKERNFGRKQGLDCLFLYFLFALLASGLMLFTGRVTIIVNVVLLVGLLVTIGVVSLTIRHEVIMYKYSLFLGLQLISLTCSILAMGILFLPFHLQTIPIVICCLISPSIIVLLKMMINKGIYARHKGASHSKLIIASTVGTTLGIGIGRMFVPQTNKGIIIIIVFLSTILSIILMMAAIASLYQAYLIKKYNYKFD